MLKELSKIKYYAIMAIVAVGVFTWAGFTGTRLTGDDEESVENKRGYYSNSRSTGGRGYNRFHHK